VSENDRAVTIQWKIPASNGEPILDYTVVWNGGSKPVDANTTKTTITNLTNGTHYQFTVTARNVLGSSTASPASAVAIPFGTPTPPTTVNAKPTVDGSGEIDLSWSGANGNGRDITKYTWTLSNGATGFTTGATTATAKAPVGVDYTFTVTATNGGNLTSRPSPVSNKAMPMPSAPKNATLTKGADGDKTIKMTWGAATSYGTPPSYQVSINSGGWAAHDSGDTFEGDFGTKYTMRVRAVVHGNPGAADTSNSVTPADKSASATVSRGPEYNGYSGCPANCYKVNVNYDGFSSGNYTITIWLRDAGDSSGHALSPTFSESLSGSGTVTLDYTLGTVGEHDDVWVVITGPGPTVTSPKSHAWG
jgi:hypothetical protein